MNGVVWLLVLACSQPRALDVKEVEALYDRFSAEKGAAVVGIDTEAKVVQFVQTRLVSLDENQQDESRFLAATRLKDRTRVSGRLAIRGDDKQQKTLARAVRSVLGDGAKTEKVTPEMFRLRVFAGDKLVWERQKAAGSTDNIPVQFLLPKDSEVEKLSIVAEQFIDLPVQSKASASITMRLEKIVQALRKAGKDHAGQLSLHEIRSAIKESVEKGWVNIVTTDQGDVAALDSLARRILQAQLFDRVLEAKVSAPERESAETIYQLKENIETTEVSFDLRKTKSVVLPVASQTTLELRKR